MNLKDFKIYYLIPVFIMIDSSMSYLAVKLGMAYEKNPVLTGVVGTWQGLYLALCMALLFYRMISLEYETGMKLKTPYNIILTIQAFVIISNSLLVFTW